jgi:hypothetical protein
VGLYGLDSRMWLFLFILVTAVTVFSLYQKVWSVEGGFSLHGFGSVKNHLCYTHINYA